MRPDLNLLIALDALLEEESVAGAARRMNLSAPAMSRTLSRIRKAIGDPILVSAGRKLVPTPRALELRGEIKGALEQASQLLRPSPAVDLTRLERRFRVRANDIFLGVHSSRLLERMHDEMPRAMLCFTPEEDDVDVEALRTGRIDLFISVSRTLGPEIRVQSLFSTRVIGVARAGHPLFQGDVTPERLVQWGHIGVSRRGKSSGPIDEALAALGLRRHVKLVVPTPSSALLAMHNSDLILPLPEQLAVGARDAGLAIRLFNLPVPLQLATVTQAWHPRYQHDSAHQWLRRTIRALATSGG